MVNVSKPCELVVAITRFVCIYQDLRVLCVLYTVFLTNGDRKAICAARKKHRLRLLQYLYSIS